MSKKYSQMRAEQHREKLNMLLNLCLSCVSCGNRQVHNFTLIGEKFAKPFDRIKVGGS